ncbi:MAG: DUF2490 domain-containing protein [Bacteroidetes bacterium]|nr:DUF2490 domain-containing protein [Bacteroidota bacterium]
MRLFKLFVLALTITTVNVRSQTTTQVWIEQMYGIRFNTQAVLSIDPTISALTSDKEWWSVDVNSNFEYAVTPNIDLHTAVVLSYTKQREISDVFEVRPVLGARYTLYIGEAGWRWYAFGRYEVRAMDYTEADSSIIKQRARLRVGTLVPLGPEGLVPGSTYAMADVEPFFNLDGAPPERYNDRILFRVGLGYRLDRLWRVEVLYCYQASRTTYLSGFDNESNILRFRIRLVP